MPLLNGHTAASLLPLDPWLLIGPSASLYSRQKCCVRHCLPISSHVDFLEKRWPKFGGFRSQLTLRSASVLAHQDVDLEALVVVVLTRLEAALEAATTTAEATAVPARR